MKLKTTVGGLVVLLVSLGGCGEAEVPEIEDEASSALFGGALSADFSAAYVGCDEFAGVGVVPLANVADLVPDDYTIIEPAPGLAVVVAQAGSCDAISVNGNWAQPGVFAQFGVAVVPPLTPGNGDFYQIFFTTTHAPLALRLRLLGVNARRSSQLSYEIAAGPTLSVDVPRPSRYAFTLDGPITLPDPSAPGNASVFNYYAKTKRNGNVLQQNSVQGIRFGEGSGVTLTAVGEDMEAIVGGEFLMFPFFSSPEIFDQADLSVQTDAF